MTTLRFRIAATQFDASIISKLRKITKLPISEIRKRASEDLPILELTAFNNDWEDVRNTLVHVAAEISNGSLPLTITESFEDAEHSVSTESLFGFIQHFRHIELETQRNTMLENGDINSPEEFEPWDDDWTQP